MSILILAEHDNKHLKENCYHTVTAAKKLHDDIEVVVIGSGCQAVAEQAAKIADVKKVILIDNPVYEHQLAENLAAVLQKLSSSYDYIVTAASTFGKNILPRAAALCDVNLIADITDIVDQNTFVRPIYAGNAFATVKTDDKIKIMTVRATSFTPANTNNTLATIEKQDIVIENNLSQFVKHELNKSERPELTAAKAVVSGGRGLQNGENFKLLEALADILNAAIGASRAAVDAGYVPNDYQVGQTGKIVAPQLYIAVGISGAIQHLAGMKDSKVIVAINKDEDAPIFQVADFGLVADLFQAIPELIETLQKR